ncbi:flagellar biosynthetic protein FliQ [Frigidibacter sp. MR17.24]|uniref:flagellar biosynthetic protein FliQ n=1 Tax=Frigidibacter sp. MR17.24 TaxID=3127345 RepID=UPI003FA55F27
MLTEAQIFDVLRQGLWVSVRLSAPLLAVSLLAGVTIGLLQALTGIQEMTLTFVPKVALMLAVFWVSMSSMTSALVDFFTRGLMPLVAPGG